MTNTEAVRMVFPAHRRPSFNHMIMARPNVSVVYSGRSLEWAIVRLVFTGPSAAADRAAFEAFAAR